MIRQAFTILLLAASVMIIVGCSPTGSAAGSKELGYREPRYPGDDQHQIDAMRRKMEERALLGGTEVKPWEERYIDHNSNLPYQGPAPQYRQ